MHSIETLGALDGPGLRAVAFLQGCPLRCAYCHNPDTWAFSGGEELEAEELAQRLLRYKAYFRRGGVTFSGGEPLAQAAFVCEAARLLQGQGVHVAVDTSGEAAGEEALQLLDAADLLLLDIKHSDPAGFQALTGRPMDGLLRTLSRLRANGRPVWIRQVTLPGYTDSVEQLEGVRRLIQGLRVERVQLLPYHTLGVGKYQALGIPYRLAGVQPPEKAVLDRLNQVVAGWSGTLC